MQLSLVPIPVRLDSPPARPPARPRATPCVTSVCHALLSQGCQCCQPYHSFGLVPSAYRDTLAIPLQRLYGGSAADDKGPSVLESAAMCAIAPLAS